MKNNNVYRSNAEGFWNDYENIKWFKDEPASPYWVDFFRNFIDRKMTVLDLGCGAGRNTEVLFKLGFDVYASDFYENMVATTKKRLSGAGMLDFENKISRGDMLNINFPDNFFDAVVSNGVLHNAYDLDELEKAILEIARVLKSGGYLCFNLFSSNQVASFRNIGDSVYVTKEELIMTLVNGKEFEIICSRYDLRPSSPIVQYQREVTTGMRSIMRGVMVKK